MTNSNTPISIVIPAFNAEASISLFFKDLLKVFEKFSIQIVIVNDCSTDNTHEECLKLSKENGSELTYIKLSKNVGEHNAVMAGLKHSTGDWIIVMDDDLQHPPSSIITIYNELNNFDACYTFYIKRKHIFWKILKSNIILSQINLMLFMGIIRKKNIIFLEI